MNEKTPPAAAASESETRRPTEHQDPTTGRFLPGNRANPVGRKPGLKDRRAARRENLLQLLEYGAAEDKRKKLPRLPPRHERWRALFLHEDPNVRVAMEKFAYEIDFGKAKQVIDVLHQSEVVADAAEKMREFQRELATSTGAAGHNGNSNGATQPEQHPN